MSLLARYTSVSDERDHIELHETRGGYESRRVRWGFARDRVLSCVPLDPGAARELYALCERIGRTLRQLDKTAGRRAAAKGEL